MHSDEVRYAQVATGHAPPEEKEPRAAVRSADGVRASYALEVCTLRGRGDGHEESQGQADERDEGDANLTTRPLAGSLLCEDHSMIETISVAIHIVLIITAIVDQMTVSYTVETLK